jgi:DNA polymerase III subunit delta
MGRGGRPSGTAATEGAVPRVIALIGPDDWRREQEIAALRRRVLGEPPDPLAETRVRAGEVDLVALLDAARTRPLLGGRKLVVLQAVEALTAPDWVLLADYVAASQRSTTLVLGGLSVPASGAPLLRLIEVVDCPALRAWEVPRWLAGRLRDRGLPFEPGVPEAMQAALGDDPAALDAAIDRLVLLRGERREPVTREDIALGLEPRAHGTVWEFVEAFEDRDTGRALRLLAALLELGEPPESILRLIARSRRQLLAGAVARSGGADDDGVLAAMGVHAKARAAPRVRRAILDRASRHRPSELAAAWPRLLEADSALKGGGGGGAGDILAMLVLTLAGRGGTGGSRSHS